MRLFYRQGGNGEVFYAVYDSDQYRFVSTAAVPLSVLEVDEVAGGNQAVCADLKRTEGKMDATGNRKYYVENGELHSRDGWVEFVPPRMVMHNG